MPAERYGGRRWAADANSAACGSRRSAQRQLEQGDAEDRAQDECTLCLTTADCQFYTPPSLRYPCNEEETFQATKIQET